VSRIAFQVFVASRVVAILGMAWGGVAGTAQEPPALRSGPFTLSEADRGYWAFQPVREPPPPRAPAGTAVDAFLLDAMASRGVSPNGQATPREQLRRLSFDLTGLPPDPAEVAAFERDPSDAAWRRQVDRHLASPAFGERWARHWLDVVRYAESNGYERDGPKPNAWRYRDYVIRAFNGDRPYDRFVREQLAGDELAGELSGEGTDLAAWRDAVIATGFYRLHVWDDEPDSTVAAEFDDLDDIMVATGTAFLGMTLGCARCHDHKFDPVSQKDYYSLLSFFRGLDPYGQHKTGGGGRGTGRIERPLALPADLERWQADRDRRLTAVREQMAAATDPAERKRLEESVKALQDERAPFDWTLAAVEIGPEPKPTRILHRGDAQSPRAAVSPEFPAVLDLPVPEFPALPPGAVSSGRRRVLAEWVASPSNPFTARVWVNRVWQHLFGIGLVPTPDDFGRTGMPPTHPELLDHLAASFVRAGWSVKHLVRTLVCTEAYRRSTAAESASARAADESNTLYWRQNLRRLEAEAIRDALLAASGELNRKAEGPSVYPSLPAEVHGTQDSSGKGWSDSPPDEQRRRSVYLVVKRALKVPLLECLDFANSASPSGTRTTTTTAPQALMLLNDPFIQERAAALAQRVARESDDGVRDRIAYLYRVALQRPPSAAEHATAETHLREVRNRWAAEGNTDPETAALESLCRVILNLNEFIYVD